MSTGPHLEIGFSDLRGTPVAGSSSTMLAFLHSTKSSAPTRAPAAVAGVGSSSGGGGASGSGASGSGGSGGGIDLNPLDAIKSFFSGILDKIVKEAKYAALLLVVIVGGVVLLAKGINRTTHATPSA